MARTQITERRTERLTERLGIQGWYELDPLLLAALALEAPVLLVGAHGTAKTLVAERVAAALGAEFRHYNASLLNYDDLVGIPLPDDDGGLRFVGTAGAVWGASFVFFDEVNRCRPDLQNKLFPIVHERRIAGMRLDDLEHRWAAMNPPSAADSFDGYLGAEPLDAALADRFHFIIGVPSWRQLTRAQREALVANGSTADHDVPLGELVAATRAELDVVRAALSDTIVHYAVVLVDLLDGAGITLSPRRAAILREAVLATVAAARVLGRDIDTQRAAELVALNGLPQWADAEPPSPATVVGAHSQAFGLAMNQSDKVQRALLEERDPVRRLRRAIDLGAAEDVIATTVLGALSSLPTEVHRVALAAVLVDTLAGHDLTPAAWSAIADRAVRVHRPSVTSTQIAPGRRLESWRKASAWMGANPAKDRIDLLVHNVLNACGPELLVGVDADEAAEAIRSYAVLFRWGK
jgi:MoxR-like ATPase